MGLFKYQKGSLYLMQLLIIKLVCCLGWLSAIALGQLELSESISGSVSFPDLGLTCIANLAVFFWSFLRGRLYLEMGAKDALTFLTGRIKLKEINGWDDISNGFGLTTCWDQEHLSDCSVVMLSKETPNSSMRQFVEYVANVHNVRSVVLQYIPLQSLPLTVNSICNCQCNDCGCIVFWTHVDVTVMVAEQIPGTLKLQSDSLCLLPSIDCLKNGCHGCKQGVLHVEDDFGTKELKEGDSQVRSTAAVCGISYSSTSLGEPATCICIPVRHEAHGRDTDRWTELLIRCFRFKDYEIRSVIVRSLDTSSISRDLENYMAKNGKCYAAEEYSTAALIVPRLTEILINLVLVLWFKVDGLSSALVARRAIKQYIVDAEAREFAAHVFMNKAEVSSNDDNTNVYQVLSFRGKVWNPRALSLIVGIVNLACSITWAVLVALEGGRNKWYHTHSMPPSKGRLLVIFVGIAIALSMDCVDLYLCLQKNARLSIRDLYSDLKYLRWSIRYLYKYLQYARNIMILCTMIVLQILCIVSSSVVARNVGIKAFDRWVYGAVQGLVWAKWGMGTYLLGQYVDETELSHESTGKYMCSSAFFLNAILAGARANWQFS